MFLILRIDLFLVCDGDDGDKFLEIWVNKKAEGFSLAQKGGLPKGVQSISFADIGKMSTPPSCCGSHSSFSDRDGTIDMVFTTCSSVSQSTGIGTDCYIHIAYNQQLPLCTPGTRKSMNERGKPCREPDDLCTPDPSFRFDLSERVDNKVRLVSPARFR